MIEILRYKESEYEDIECSNCKSLLRVWGKEEKMVCPVCENKLTKKKKAAPTSYGWLIDEWNSLEKLGITPIKKIAQGTQRIKSVQSRAKQYDKEDFIKAIDNIKGSSFLQGMNNRGWTITFDWFIKPTNFAKVLEGNYTKKEEKKESPTLKEDNRELSDEEWVNMMAEQVWD